MTTPVTPERIVAAFTRALRSAGLPVPTGSAVVYMSALGQVGLEEPEHVYWAGRATLVRRPEDVEVYDRVFTSYWADVGRAVTLVGDTGDVGSRRRVV